MVTKRQTSKSSSTAYRREIATRFALAVIGGYALANISGIVLSYLLPMPKSDAVMTGILLSFAIYTCAVIWVFAVQSVRKAAVGLVAPSAVLGIIAILLKVTGVAP
ncbi:MAG: DUF3649 domain-containing protein [Cellvibrio sp.]